MGPCAGGAVYSPAITDFIVMVDKTSHMFITGPDVIKTVTGEDVELRGARRRDAPTTRSRCRPPHRQRTRRTPSSIVEGATSWASCPQNNLDEASGRSPGRPSDLETVRRWTSQLDTLIPDSPNQPYDMHKVIELVVDDADFLEIQSRCSRRTSSDRLRPRRGSPGRRRRQPADADTPACLDIDASEKAARFVRTCDAFNIPVITFVDVPGFLPGTDSGVERHHPPRRQAALRVHRGDGPARSR